MPKTKAQKQKTIEDLNDNFKKAKSIVFVDIQGLKANDLVILRRKLKETKGLLKVAKKTLINLVLKNGGDRVSAVSARKMKGEVAVLFSLEDPIQPLKALYDFSKGNQNLKFISGILDNFLLGKDEVLAIAQLPSKEELLAKLVGAIAGPISGLINVLQGNVKGLVYVLSSIKK
ncbi:MAG: 50S ribosomal protein L10 [bacterium]|nr:50S ribosomal protein L10 [bacterium]